MGMKNPEIETLQKMLSDGEAVYRIDRMSARPIYVIGTFVPDIARELDIAGCIEETLHSLLDEGHSDEEIYAILAAEKMDNGWSEDDGDYYIDRDYGIYGFYPTDIKFTGVQYIPPRFQYALRRVHEAKVGKTWKWDILSYCPGSIDVTFPSDSTVDDDVLDAVKLHYPDAIPGEMVVLWDKDGITVISIMDYRPLFRFELVGSVDVIDNCIGAKAA